MLWPSVFNYFIFIQDVYQPETSIVTPPLSEPHPSHTHAPPPQGESDVNGTPSMSGLTLDTNLNISSSDQGPPGADFPVNVVMNVDGTTLKESEA